MPFPPWILFRSIGGLSLPSKETMDHFLLIPPMLFIECILLLVL